MVQKDFNIESEYNSGFSVSELLPLNNVVIVTSRDSFVIDDSKDVLSKGRNEVMQHFLKGENVGNAIGRQGQVIETDMWVIVSITNLIMDFNYFRRGGEVVFPLFLYSDSLAQQTIDQPAERVPNLNLEIVNKIATSLDLKFTLDNTSPPLEGCPQGGVVLSSDTKPQGGVVLSSDTKPQGGVVLSSDTKPQGRVILSSDTKPQGGVVLSSDTKPQGGVVLSSDTKPQGGVVLSSDTKPQGGVELSQSAQTDPSGRFVTTINTIPIKRNFVENLPYNPALKQRAREKRKAGILSEVLFWQQVHKGMFHNIDFDRQRIIGNYIVDFYVKTLGLVIEIDGSSHNNKVEYDRRRQQYLESFGLKVYRIRDHAVKKFLTQVMVDLERFIVEVYGETTPESGHTTTPAYGHPSRGGEFGFGQRFVRGEFGHLDLLDYIYAVLHSPAYREKYKEFLTIDLPKVPYPTNRETFWKLVDLGSEIRQFHLLENPKINQFVTTYPVSGNNEVTRKMSSTSPGFELSEPTNQTGRVWINDNQFFEGVPFVAWNFYIGGYQPAQKWLKDRYGRALSCEDIIHYQKIIVALTETDRLMKEIDAIGI